MVGEVTASGSFRVRKFPNIVEKAVVFSTPPSPPLDDGEVASITCLGSSAVRNATRDSASLQCKLQHVSFSRLAGKIKLARPRNRLRMVPDASDCQCERARARCLGREGGVGDLEN
mmetsp:Transcript_19215/g.48596  ORF Transcript_19215/g.48596 Transcript_19215/m.48596 type:complete len:116 (-) Transcript_19215:195-542(-)